MFFLFARIISLPSLDEGAVTLVPVLNQGLSIGNLTDIPGFEGLVPGKNGRNSALFRGQYLEVKMSLPVS
jgi:hypothetical protein